MNTTQNGLLVTEPKANSPQTTSKGSRQGRGSAVVVGACALPTVVFATGGFGAGNFGDITGNNHGGSSEASAVVGSMVAQVFTTQVGPRGADLVLDGALMWLWIMPPESHQNALF